MHTQQPAYSLTGDSFRMTAFDQAPAFSSFLPGIAGVMGIPLWVYYCNRGQAVHSFGVHHKGNAILEFNPANTAYENVALKGFRTFLLIDGHYHEPFSPLSQGQRLMDIQPNHLTIEETHHKLGLQTQVRYFLLPNQPIAALVRRVLITNTGPVAINLEGLDGLPKVIPYGLQLGAYKEMSNLMRSWAQVRGLEKNLALYSMRSSTEDSAQVQEVTGSYYYLSQCCGKRLPLLADPELVFGRELSLQLPQNLLDQGLQGLLAVSQAPVNKIPCAFAAIKASLQPGQSLSLDSLMGFTESDAQLEGMLPAFLQPAYLDQKEEEAKALVQGITRDVHTQSGQPLFDQYIRQCYLDNFLRGGYPLVYPGRDGDKVLHLFSRKHGDPERDYNFFTTAGEYYSQGNGNFRDVCQNRRLDVSVHPAVGDYNVWSFVSLIQMDGYNPLEIRPSTFLIQEKDQPAAQALLARYIQQEAGLSRLLQAPFTPGQLCSYIAARQLKVKGSMEELVDGLLFLAQQRVEAGFGEGYWSDHFGYCLDLVEDYLQVFPDQEQALFFGRSDYRFYDSPVCLKPRADTQVITPKGIRHYGALARDEQKLALPGFVQGATNWLKDASGQVVQVQLFAKLLILAANKLALLDPSGLGILMDGGKPGWCDAMNGLPGLMGSGLPETVELLRLIKKLHLVCPKTGSLALPQEAADFVLALAKVDTKDALKAYQHRSQLLEAFRASIRPVLSGRISHLDCAFVKDLLGSNMRLLEQSLAHALELGQGILPTYLVHRATKWVPQLKQDGSPRLSSEGFQHAVVQQLELVQLPPFLEGPARLLGAAGPADRQKMAQMAERIKDSPLYDSKLKMYKTSVSLEDQGMELGRIRAFTPGWLERESVFLHMAYKYILGLFKAGLYKQAFEAFREGLIPFQDPQVYGRSILENSSFLASSVNPDPATHGRGYVARLSGSTVEALSLWQLLCTGGQLFSIVGGELCLSFSPILPDWLFDEAGFFSFTLLGSCQVKYHNPGRRPTFGHDAVKACELQCSYKNGNETSTPGASLKGQAAVDVRAGKIQRISVQFS